MPSEDEGFDAVKNAIPSVNSFLKTRMIKEKSPLNSYPAAIKKALLPIKSILRSIRSSIHSPSLLLLHRAAAGSGSSPPSCLKPALPTTLPHFFHKQQGK